jgi:hypothetical protein
MQYVVYKITCNSPNIDHFYIGSSEDLEQRKRYHKYKSNRETNTIKLYNTIRAYDGFDNWTFEVVESGTVDTRFEIKSRERYYYDKLQPSLNMIRPQASKEEIRLYDIEYSKQYKFQNEDRIEQKIHCDTCNCECRKDNMARHNKTKIHLKNLELNKQCIEK